LASGGADPNAMLGRLFMTFSGSYGFLAFAAICGGFYISGPLCGYIIRKPGAATLAETMNGVAQVLSGNPNGVMVLAAGFLQGFMSDLGFAFFGYKRWTVGTIALSGALAPWRISETCRVGHAFIASNWKRPGWFPSAVVTSVTARRLFGEAEEGGSALFAAARPRPCEDPQSHVLSVN